MRAKPAKEPDEGFIDSAVPGHASAPYLADARFPAALPAFSGLLEQFSRAAVMLRGQCLTQSFASQADFPAVLPALAIKLERLARRSHGCPAVSLLEAASPEATSASAKVTCPRAAQGTQCRDRRSQIAARAIQPSLGCEHLRKSDRTAQGQRIRRAELLGASRRTSSSVARADARSPSPNCASPRKRRFCSVKGLVLPANLEPSSTAWPGALSDSSFRSRMLEAAVVTEGCATAAESPARARSRSTARWSKGSASRNWPVRNKSVPVFPNTICASRPSPSPRAW